MSGLFCRLNAGERQKVFHLKRFLNFLLLDGDPRGAWQALKEHFPLHNELSVETWKTPLAARTRLSF